jgi:hypothetical protein
MLRELIHSLLTPPVFEDEEQTRSALLLNTILLALLVPAIPELLITLVQGNPEDTLTIIGLIGGHPDSAGSHAPGQVHLASVLISLAVMGAVTLFVLTGNGLHDLVILGYPLVMALASLLLGQHARCCFVCSPCSA